MLRRFGGTGGSAESTRGLADTRAGGRAGWRTDEERTDGRTDGGRTPGRTPGRKKSGMYENLKIQKFEFSYFHKNMADLR